MSLSTKSTLFLNTSRDGESTTSMALILVSLVDLHWHLQLEVPPSSWAVLTGDTAWWVWLDKGPRQCLCQQVLHDLGRTESSPPQRHSEGKTDVAIPPAVERRASGRPGRCSRRSAQPTLLCAQHTDGTVVCLSVNSGTVQHKHAISLSLESFTSFLVTA